MRNICFPGGFRKFREHLFISSCEWLLFKDDPDDFYKGNRLTYSPLNWTVTPSLNSKTTELHVLP